MKKVTAIIGLVVMGLGLLNTLYGYATEFTKLKSNVQAKATKSEVAALHSKVDKVIIGLCIIDKRTCVLKGE